jgi:hypothetical protein
MAVKKGLAALQAGEDGNLQVAFPGDGAPGTVPEMNPIQFGGVAQSTEPDSTADGQVVRPWFDEVGRLVTRNDGALSPATDAVAQGADAASAGALDVLVTDALVATKVEIKASAGRLHFVHVYNPNAFAVWVHFYDALAANVTVGTTTRKLTLGVPASVDRAFVLPVPVGFATGITHAATKTNATGSTAPDAGLSVSVGYK